jgi:hypothetical protein
MRTARGAFAFPARVAQNTASTGKLLPAAASKKIASMQPDISTRARRYLAALPPAVAGSGGDAATYKAAMALVKGMNMTAEQALPFLMEWNATSCVPPWTEGELRCKLASAARSSRPAAYLLNDSGARGAREPVGHGSARPVGERAQKAARRRLWPAFVAPSPDDLATIARLRSVLEDAAYSIAAHRYMWRCCWQQQECMAIRFRSFAQVRRLDGKPFTRADGSTMKALNLPGSEGAFLNPGGMDAPGLPVLLTEGAVSLLEAAEAIFRADSVAGQLHSVAVLAAVSAQSRFTADHLAKMAGRRVRIIPDADPAGQDAAANWTATLRATGCTVDCIRLPDGSKDLGEALRQLPASHSYWHKLLTF